MKRFTITTTVTSMTSDLVTPVGLFLNLRSKFERCLLFESSDYHTSENSFSYIAADPIASVKIDKGEISQLFPDGSKVTSNISDLDSDKSDKISGVIRQFLSSFEVVAKSSLPKGVINGIFGYLSYDSIPLCESITFKEKGDKYEKIPLLYYTLYRYLFVIDHYSQVLHIVENSHPHLSKELCLNPLDLATNSGIKLGSFKLDSETTSLMTDQDYIDSILRCKKHISRGDVFQIVPSRKFKTKYSGDDFQVYRQLRRINPSPYLFYCDFNSYRLMGSSPEAQLVVRDKKATISPIAGTYKRTGNDEEDSLSMKRLSTDPKETAEHVMLVDLARNDLSIHCYPVQVDRYKELQLYSHVMHLVSHVSGTLKEGVDPLAVLTTTFPAGTLSGAPKYKAMEIIDQVEVENRNFYAGAIGCISFSGESNHAIMIRTILSKNNTIYMQAGAGIVADSEPQKELEEVKSKLAAVVKACKLAEEV